jgi:hypothetical protein
MKRGRETSAAGGHGRPLTRASPRQRCDRTGKERHPMSRLEFCVSRWPLMIVAALMVLSTSGCVGIAAQLMYLAGAGLVKPDFEGLKGKRVAVVCVSNRSAYGSGKEADALARMVAAILRREVKDIELVSQTEIANWKDSNDWDEMDFRTIGRGVKAEMLVAINVSKLDYYEGHTLYKGRADLSVTVYDMSGGGKIAWSKSMPDFQFPQHGGRPVTDMVEANFQKQFLDVLARDIARNFHSYDRVVMMAQDAALGD